VAWAEFASSHHIPCKKVLKCSSTNAGDMLVANDGDLIRFN
jgi:hypothetical protein